MKTNATMSSHFEKFDGNGATLDCRLTYLTVGEIRETLTEIWPEQEEASTDIDTIVKVWDSPTAKERGDKPKYIFSFHPL